MNIAILTHPLGANYGGILQAFALSTYLKKQGHSVCVINRQPNLPLLRRLIKRLLIALHHPRYNAPRYRHLIQFLKKHINCTKPIWTSKQMCNYVKKNDINAVFVGSDQVWRHSFAISYGYNYFLDFVPNGVIRCSYAASFGLDKWEYNDDQTSRIKRLLTDFNAISVREDFGVDLCNKYLSANAEQVLDPTLLLQAQDYASIISPRLEKDSYIFVYWLGTNENKQRALENIGTESKKVVEIAPRGGDVLAPIEDWLSYIYYADRIITDSFHGCAFSILFQKQFTIFANDSGGNGRLQSLFTMLEINPESECIDYSSVIDRLNFHRNKSYGFINKTLQ